MRRCLMGLGGRPTSTDGFILGPSHGTVGRLVFLWSGGIGVPGFGVAGHSPAPRFKQLCLLPVKLELRHSPHASHLNLQCFRNFFISASSSSPLTACWFLPGF